MQLTAKATESDMLHESGHVRGGRVWPRSCRVGQAGRGNRISSAVVDRKTSSGAWPTTFKRYVLDGRPGRANFEIA